MHYNNCLKNFVLWYQEPSLFPKALSFSIKDIYCVNICFQPGLWYMHLSPLEKYILWKKNYYFWCPLDSPREAIIGENLLLLVNSLKGGGGHVTAVESYKLLVNDFARSFKVTIHFDHFRS